MSFKLLVNIVNELWSLENMLAVSAEIKPKAEVFEWLTAFDCVQSEDTWLHGWESEVFSHGSVDQLIVSLKEKMTMPSNRHSGSGESAVDAGADVSTRIPAPARQPGQLDDVDLLDKEDIRTFAELYTFIDVAGAGGVKLMVSSDHAKALGLTTCPSTFLQVVQKRIEAELWHFYNQKTFELGGASTLCADMASKKVLPFSGLCEPTSRFYFAGVVAQTPSKESFPLCSVFGRDLFLHGAGCDTYSADCLVPAWCCKVVGKADQATVKLNTQQVTCKINADGHVSILPHGAVLPSESDNGQKCVAVTLSIPFLEPTSNFIKGAEGVHADATSHLARLQSDAEKILKSARGRAMVSAQTEAGGSLVQLSQKGSSSHVGVSAAHAVRARLLAALEGSAPGPAKGKGEGKLAGGVSSSHLMK